ncbi:MAG: hypothetical protein ACW967_00070 [Candidatus Hodarchaeales archaeon]|jgi:hypothetical protein
MLDYNLITQFGTVIAALGAVLLSLYNWYTYQKGAEIKPLPFVYYGIWSIDNGHMLYIPLLLTNDGIKPGMVTTVKLFFKSETEKREIRFGRRVELKESGQKDAYEATQQDFSEQVPPLPIFVGPKESQMYLLEYYDSQEGGGIITKNKQLTCEIEIESGMGKKSSVEFPFFLTEEDEKKTQLSVAWIENKN